MMKFEIGARDGDARCGEIATGHGSFSTPAFMPVGTQGSVKAVTQKNLREIGAEIILSNTYHLYLRPGTQLLEDAGGLHRFMNWTGPILTDSGGYQVFSLRDLRTLGEDGVVFRSHLDGSKHTFTPESVVAIQRSIGSDVMMVLDECTPYPCDRAYAEASGERTLRWAARCRDAFAAGPPRYEHGQAIFGIVQGSVFPELRRESAARLSAMAFDGYGIGGLAVGEPAELMYEMIEVSNAALPQDRPRYLMGVGTPGNLLEAIARGVDMFDCVLPTRNGRNAMLFTRNGAVTITNARYRDDFSPVDPECECPACTTTTRAYLRHLFMVKEILGLHLATIHNLYFYQWLMRTARAKIREGAFGRWKQAFSTSIPTTSEV